MGGAVRLNARLTKTRGSGEAGADDSVRAAGAALGRLRQLVAQLLRTANTTDAAREWSPPLATPDELDRARIAIEGIRRALMEYAAASAPVRTARLTRLSESLLPVLRDLILKVLADEYAAPGTAGQDSLAAAQQRTAHLLADWTQLVQASGVTARPKFATSHVDEVSYSVDSDVAAIREALLAEPREEMWQLCGQADVTALDVTVMPLLIRFAPRLNREVLAGLPQWRETVWTSSGSHAGVLRLVPLRREIISGDSAESRPDDEESQPDGAAVPEPWCCAGCAGSPPPASRTAGSARTPCCGTVTRARLRSSVSAGAPSSACPGRRSRDPRRGLPGAHWRRESAVPRRGRGALQERAATRGRAAAW